MDKNLSLASSSGTGDLPQLIAKPVGDVLRVSGEGKKHYKAVEYCGHTYEIDDTVLLAHGIKEELRKPWVALIRDVFETNNGQMMLTVHWFYRAEDVPERYGFKRESVGPRDIFYSLHKDDVYAESIEHRCIVHFVAKPEHIPNPKRNPGFVVQKLYNPNTRRLVKLTSSNYLITWREELDRLIEKTMCRLRNHSDNNVGDHVTDEDDLAADSED